MTKKGHQKFSALKWEFFPKNRSFENLVRESFFRPPKLDAKSPPIIHAYRHTYRQTERQTDRQIERQTDRHALIQRSASTTSALHI